jgi:hypothetical protein
MTADGEGLGPRFVASIGRPEGPGWLRADRLFGAGLDDALARFADARGAPGVAVAGSLLMEAYAQRVVPPVIGACFVDGRILDAHLPQVWVDPVAGGFPRIAFAAAPVPTAGADDGVPRMWAGLVDGLDGAARAVHERTRVGRRVLRGAVANAVAVAFLHLSWHDPDRARYVATALDLLATTPGLDGLVGIEAVVAHGRAWMYTERNTCCLAFRTRSHAAVDQPYCATCPVLARTTTREMFTQAAASFAERHPDT